MAGFNNHQELVEAELRGQSLYATWRKSATQGTGASVWTDFSMAPGNPAAQFYANTPLKATQMSHSADGGIWVGKGVSPATKYLRRIMANANSAPMVPMAIKLLDYLLYYSFIDQSITDQQVMDNTATIPRYPTGDGVQIMPVCLGAQIGGASFTVSYTNSNGVAGRTTPAVSTALASATSAIATNPTGATGANCVAPFLPLQLGDTGVRSIQSVTFTSTDVGIMALVLVKPLAQMSIRGVDAPVEIDFLQDFPVLPRIVDDAYLNFIAIGPTSNLNQPMHGDILVIWN